MSKPYDSARRSEAGREWRSRLSGKNGHPAYGCAHQKGKRCPSCTREAKRAQQKAYYSKKGSKASIEYTRKQRGIKGAHLCDAVFEAQGQCCAICKSIDFGGRQPHADHDHKTGQLRGMLCNNCNRGIGHLKDSLPLLAAAFEYLLDPPSRPFLQAATLEESYVNFR